MSAIDGSLVWSVEIDSEHTADISYTVLSPIKYFNGSLYFGATRNSYNSSTGVSAEESFILSLDAQTGLTIWKAKAFGSVLDTPLILSASSSILIGEGYTFAHRNLQDGSIIWSQLLEYQILASPYSPTPESSNPPIYMATLGAIFAFDLDGNELWSIPGSMVGTPLIQEVTITQGDEEKDESVLIITDEYSVFGFADDCNGGCPYSANSTSEKTEVLTCSGNGDCKSGVCDCVYGYAGVDCQSCEEGFTKTANGCRAESEDDSEADAYIGLIVVVCIIVFFAIIVVAWWFYRSRNERDGWRREDGL